MVILDVRFIVPYQEVKKWNEVGNVERTNF